MFMRKRQPAADTPPASGMLHNDVEVLCDRLCIAFDPGGHATRDETKKLSASDRLVRTLRTLLRVSRHRRQKIEQSVQQELSISEDMRASLAEVVERNCQLEARLAACEAELKQRESVVSIESKPGFDGEHSSQGHVDDPSDGAISGVAKSGGDDCNETLLPEATQSIDRKNHGGAAVSAVETGETPDPQSTLSACPDRVEQWDDEIVDLDPTTAIPPAAEDDEFVDFNALLSEAIEQTQAVKDAADPALGGLQAFESTLAAVDDAIKPTAAESEGAPDAPPTISDESTPTQSDDLTEVAPSQAYATANSNIVTDQPQPQAEPQFDAACERAQSIGRDLQSLIETAEARRHDLDALNTSLATQLTRREELLARVDHELRERQIVLVTDIIRAEAEHLSLTEAMEAISSSVTSMTNDISSIQTDVTEVKNSIA